MSEFAWDREKHDIRTPGPITRTRVQCVCGGKHFVELKQLFVLMDNGSPIIDILPLAPLCVKCNNIVDLKDLLKKVLDNERKGSDSPTPPEAPKST